MTFFERRGYWKVVFFWRTLCILNFNSLLNFYREVFLKILIVSKTFCILIFFRISSYSFMSFIFKVVLDSLLKKVAWQQIRVELIGWRICLLKKVFLSEVKHATVNILIYVHNGHLEKVFRSSKSGDKIKCFKPIHLRYFRV